MQYIYISLLFILAKSSFGQMHFSETRQDPDYKITTTVEVIKPVNVEALNTDAQSVRVVNENATTITLEVTVNPNADQLVTLIPNANWRSENAIDHTLARYLIPGITTNWDEAMRINLIKALKQDGIDPEALNDVELVKQVSAWIFSSGRFEFLDHFVSYDVDFSSGRPTVIPELRPIFDYEKQKNKFQSDEEAIAAGIFGKSMFNARVFGHCTASATLQATIFKALGIPARFVVYIPLVDANDPRQLDMARDRIHHFGLRKTIMEGVGRGAASWSSHTFNEVYVGHRWIRLNYATLGQKPVDHQFLGLMAQVQSMADWADGNLGKTWGVHAQARHLAPLSSQNPYRSLHVSDDATSLNSTNNPHVPFNEIKVIHLKRAQNADDETLPQDVRAVLSHGSFFVSFNHGNTIPDYPYIALFRQHVSRRFVLKAAGHPDVLASEDGSWLQDNAVGFRISPGNLNAMVEGVAYSLHPESRSGDYRWDVDPGLAFYRPTGNTPPNTSGAFDKAATVVGATIATASELQCQQGLVQ